MSTRIICSGRASTEDGPVRLVARCLLLAVAELVLSLLIVGRSSAFAEEATVAPPVSAGQPVPPDTQAAADALPVHNVPVDPNIIQARISFQGGAGMIKGKADSDWSFATVNAVVAPGDSLWVDSQGTMEVETAPGAYLRMADGSKAEVVSLQPLVDIRGTVGSFFVQRMQYSAGDLVFETPAGRVQVWPDSDVRVDVLGNGSTTVSVRWGQAVVKTPGGSDVTVTQGLRTYVDPGYLPSLPVAFERSEEDSFDAWNHARARQEAAGHDKLPSAAGVPANTVGAADLAAYGDWVDYNGQQYWHPTVEGYVPYRDGYWDYVPDNGYCWVDDYPFGYTTCHYGRWLYDPYQYGWLWDWQPGWGLGWCATLSCGSDFVWCPLDLWNRPCWGLGSSAFLFGGHRFGFGACSYCDVDDLRFGRCSVRPFDRGVFDRNRNDFGLFSLNGHGRQLLNFSDRSQRVLDVRPDSLLRGRESLAGFSGTAVDHVARLEAVTRMPSAGNAVSYAGVRTPTTAHARTASVRNTQISPIFLSNAGQIGRPPAPRQSAIRAGLGGNAFITPPGAASFHAAGAPTSPRTITNVPAIGSHSIQSQAQWQHTPASSTIARPPAMTAPSGRTQSVPQWVPPSPYNVAPSPPSAYYAAPSSPRMSMPRAAPSLSAPTYRSAPSPSFSAPTYRSTPSPSFSAPTYHSAPAPSFSAPTFHSAPSGFSSGGGFNAGGSFHSGGGGGGFHSNSVGGGIHGGNSGGFGGRR